MRLKNRELTERAALMAVLNQCQTMRVAMFDQEYPYIVPVSFGYEWSGDQIVLYFHGATEGKKHDLIAANPHVCIEVDLMHGYRETQQGITVDYASVIGYGTADIVEGADAHKGIQTILHHCGFQMEDDSLMAPLQSGAVCIYRIVLDKFTGKKRF